MELRRTRAEARWFLHAQGHTLGPYDDQGVLKGLEQGEFLPSDKIYSAQDGTWTILSTHPYFQKHRDLRSIRRAENIPSPPSPRTLRAKTATPPPVPSLPRKAPVIEIAPPAPEPRPDPVPEPPPQVSRRHNPLVTRVEPLPEPEPLPEALAIAPEREPAPPEEKGLLEQVQLGPDHVVHVEPLVLPRAPAAQGAELLPRAPAASIEIFEDVDLKDMARDLERALDQAPRAPRAPTARNAELLPNVSTPEVDAQIPARPEIKPVFLADPASWARPPEENSALSPRVIHIQLKLPENGLGKAILLALVVALAAGAGIWFTSNGNKTRDQKNFRLSDPSNPIAVPLEAVDPNPPLKAPTRPQRE